MFYFRSLTFLLFVAAEVFLCDRSMMALWELRCGSRLTFLRNSRTRISPGLA
jgi:hypothetical protein